MFARKPNNRFTEQKQKPRMNPNMGMNPNAGFDPNMQNFGFDPNMGMNPNVGFDPNMQNFGYDPNMQGPNFDPNFGFDQQGPNIDPNMSSMFPSLQFDRLQHEIKENRRRISNLNRRVTRLENYLRIRDTSDATFTDGPNSEFTL